MDVCCAVASLVVYVRKSSVSSGASEFLVIFILAFC